MQLFCFCFHRICPLGLTYNAGSTYEGRIPHKQEEGMKTFQLLWHFLMSGRRLKARQEGKKEGRKNFY